MVRVGDFVEHRAGAARAVAPGVEGDEVVAERDEEAGLEEVGVEVRARVHRPRQAVAGEERTDALRGPHRGTCAAPAAATREAEGGRSPEF